MYIPPARLDAIESGISDQLHASVDYYVSCDPFAQWSALAEYLYDVGEMAALEKAKTYIEAKHEGTVLWKVCTRIHAFRCLRRSLDK